MTPTQLAEIIAWCKAVAALGTRKEKARAMGLDLAEFKKAVLAYQVRERRAWRKRVVMRRPGLREKELHL